MGCDFILFIFFQRKLNDYYRHNVALKKCKKLESFSLPNMPWKSISSGIMKSELDFGQKWYFEKHKSHQNLFEV